MPMRCLNTENARRVKPLDRSDVATGLFDLTSVLALLHDERCTS